MKSLRKLFSKISKKVIIWTIVFIMGFGLFSAARPAIDEFLLPFGRTPFVLVLRDLAVATYAHIKAGDEIPYDFVYGIEEMDWNRIDYSRYGVISPTLTWELQTNSVWVSDKVRTITPFFEYEGIIEWPISPVAVFLMPYRADESFHILGRANSQEGVVMLNERFFLEEGRQDLRQVLSTMVHELVHIQGGGFSWSWLADMNLQSNLESRTQAATIEVLAAMCHYRDEVACKTFWSEIESYARGSLLMRLRMYGYEDWYDRIANVLWRDSEDTLARNKSLRHWMNDDTLKQYYYEIINNYQKAPWEDLIIAGICGEGLRTGQVQETEDSKNSQTRKVPLYEQLIMSFDDTRSMLGDGLVNLVCSLPRGPEVH